MKLLILSLALLVVLCTVYSATTDGSHVLLWKDRITDPTVIKRLESIDYTTNVQKRQLVSGLDTVSNKIATAVYNLLWKVISTM
ncbi:hypothetical protein AYI68_g4966 [Smittium mucronatum]|uniref:Uncharacterized protein n=1 Tax=Smittium mucronatum TaxID=133383 RepID=A0A1R0GVM3_9FUNG|nr:hypothetical protein AYI68_g4966 [Smittium mucronatum]